VTQLAFRRAVLYAIDREELTDSMNRGLSRVAHSIVHPDVAEYREIERSIVQYEYDPRRATQLIEELGYSLGPDATFRDGAGQRLSLEIRTTAQVQGGQAIFPVAHYLQRVGVALETTVVPVQRVSDREYRATFPALEYTSGRTDLGSPRLKLFHSAAAGLRENRFQASGNYARYMNSELDELIDRYVTTIPRSERLRVLGQIVHHQTSQLTLLGLFYPLGATFSTTRMENVTRGPENTVASNVHLWDIRESER
jgi:peptide/nickel transport system substrate-binding protein